MPATGPPGASPPFRFGAEDVSDLVGDHALMRLVMLQCMDNAWYGGAVFASRAHFDTPEEPRRRNVVVIRGGGVDGARLRGLVDWDRGGGRLLALAIPEQAAAQPAAQPPAALIPAVGAWGPAFERLCREDVAAAYDGSQWVPMRVERCVFALAGRFVGALTRYLEENAAIVSDIAPAMEEMCDGFRCGKMRHHSQLCEALAVMLDKHSVAPAEFLRGFL